MLPIQRTHTHSTHPSKKESCLILSCPLQKFGTNCALVEDHTACGMANAERVSIRSGGCNVLAFLFLISGQTFREPQCPILIPSAHYYCFAHTTNGKRSLNRFSKSVTYFIGARYGYMCERTIACMRMWVPVAAFSFFIFSRIKNACNITRTRSTALTSLIDLYA